MPDGRRAGSLVRVDVVIRPMRPADAEGAARLSAQLGYPTSVTEIERRLTALGSREDHAVLVAVVGAEIAGWAHVYSSTLVQVAPFAELGGLVVGEGARGSGVGTRLLQAVEGWAADRGLAEMRVRSNEIRRHAHRFYRERGYQVEKTSLTFRKRLAP